MFIFTLYICLEVIQTVNTLVIYSLCLHVLISMNVVSVLGFFSILEMILNKILHWLGFFLIVYYKMINLRTAKVDEEYLLPIWAQGELNSLLLNSTRWIWDIFMAKKDLFKTCPACATQNVDLIPSEAQGPLHWWWRQRVQEDMPPGFFPLCHSSDSLGEQSLFLHFPNANNIAPSVFLRSLSHQLQCQNKAGTWSGRRWDCS